MASIRTARVLAAAAALPLAAALFTGVAQADNGGFADDDSNASVATITGVADDTSGNSATNQQVATGAGASNQNNNAQVNDSAFTAVHQSNDTVDINFTELW